MNTSTKNQFLPVALIAMAAIGAGIFMGTRSTDRLAGGSTGNTSEEIAKYARLQENLVNTTIFPDDFKSVPEFSLITDNSTPVTQAALADKWSVVFFGFTHCPDICPTTLHTMNTALADIQQSSAPLPQVVFITVDPVRDTVEKLTEYVNYFNEDFVGITGELADITALTRKLGIVVSYTASETDSNDYTVDHTASMLLIDPTGRVRAKFNPPHDSQTISADYIALLSELT